MSSPSSSRHQDFKTMSLVGVAHATSHFFHLLLPPLFPLFARDFAVSYAELGLLVTVFFAISGIGQALAGFLVDRVGARPVLFAALACFVAAACAGASAHSLSGLTLAAMLAGLGNSPFHPVDFTILNKRVSTARLGHAFSMHGICGSLGWAAAPVVLLGVTAWAGSWRYALLAAAVWAALVLGVLVVQRASLDDRALDVALGEGTAKRHNPEAASASVEHPLAFLKLPSVWLCISFFFWSTAALSAIQSFASPALQSMYGLPVTVTAYVVTGYTVCGALGMLAGGFLVAKLAALERVIAACLSAAALMLLLVGAQWLSPMMAMVVASGAGFATGLAGPSRDMLIKRAAPAGATGRVYGTVYSGLDVGFALAAPIVGSFLDRGWAPGVFFAAAFALGIGVMSAGLVGVGLRAKQRATRASLSGLGK